MKIESFRLVETPDLPDDGASVPGWQSSDETESLQATRRQAERDGRQERESFPISPACVAVFPFLSIQGSLAKPWMQGSLLRATEHPEDSMGSPLDLSYLISHVPMGSRKSTDHCVV